MKVTDMALELSPTRRDVPQPEELVELAIEAQRAATADCRWVAIVAIIAMLALSMWTLGLPGSVP